MVAVIDGTKIFGSYKIFYPKLDQDYEMYNCKVDSMKKDEGEVNILKRLLSRVLGNH